MSDGDFEVHQIGTMEELKVLRKFANDLIAISHTMKNPVGKWEEMTAEIRKVEQFYFSHIEKFPITV